MGESAEADPEASRVWQKFDHELGGPVYRFLKSGWLSPRKDQPVIGIGRSILQRLLRNRGFGEDYGTIKCSVDQNREVIDRVDRVILRHVQQVPPTNVVS